MSEHSPFTLALWAVAAAVVAFALWRVADPGGGAAGAPVQIDRGPPQRTEAGRRSEGRILVHVAGAVRRPGLVSVPAASRVAGALARAGGPARRADLSAVNLAATIEDGQQVVVPVRATVGRAPGAGGAAATGPGAVKPSLGSATVEQLDELDGIGPTLAQRIVDYRAEHGGFASLAELQEVEGIGEKRFESLSEALQP